MTGRRTRAIAALGAAVAVVLGAGIATTINDGIGQRGAGPRPAASPTAPAQRRLPPVTPRVAPPDLHVGLLANRPGDLAAASSPGRYDVVVLGQPRDWPSIPALKAANPRLRVFLYKDAMATGVDQVAAGRDLPRLTTGVGYVDARTHHPQWFVRDRSGAPVPFADFDGYRWMDVGNRGYQAAWADDVIADVKTYGADGVMIDDVNSGFGSHLPDGTSLPKYPTGAAWAAAQGSFLATVTRRLRASGVRSLANISPPAAGSERLWRRWLGYVDGVLFEYWTKFGTDSSVRPETGVRWERELRRADDVAAAGKLFVPVTYGDMADRVAQRYARASFLLTWGGGPAAQTWVPATPRDPWLPLDLVQVGTPLGPRRQVAPGVFARSFSAGMVVVNGTSSSTRTVALGADYVDDRGRVVSSVVLGPARAAILRRPGVGQAPS